MAISHELKHMFPSLDGFSWMPRVKVKDIKAFERRAIADGNTDFVVQNFDGTRPEETQNPEEDVFPLYFIITISPPQPWKLPVGINVVSMPGREELLLRACVSGDPLVGHWPILVTHTLGVDHLIIYLAIYDANLALVYPYQACSKLVGYVTASVNADRLLATAFRSLPPIGADVYLIDPKAPPDQRRIAAFSPHYPQSEFAPLSGKNALAAAKRVHWQQFSLARLSHFFRVDGPLDRRSR